MAENYKHLYEQTKKMLVMYQDEIVPGFREKIEDMEKNMAEVVRCKDCKFYRENREAFVTYCHRELADLYATPDGFCSYAEREAE